jgi:hypothetical protein
MSSRSRIKLSDKEFDKLLLNLHSTEEITIKSVANLNPIKQDLINNNLVNSQLIIGELNFVKDDIINRTRKRHEQETLGYSCTLNYGKDHEYQRYIYLKINSLSCKSRCCNFTIKDKSMKLMFENNKFYWEFIAIKIY